MQCKQAAAAERHPMSAATASRGRGVSAYSATPIMLQSTVRALLFALLALLAHTTHTAADSPPKPVGIHIQLHAQSLQQHALSPVHEFFQYLSNIGSQSHTLYRRCMQQYIRLNEQQSLLGSTLQQQYEVVSKLLADNEHCPLTKLQQQTFQTSLSLHIHGPQLASYKQSYDSVAQGGNNQTLAGCLHVLHTADGTVHCVTQLSSASSKQSSQHQHFNYDMLYSSNDTSVSAAATQAVLYTDLLDTTQLSSVHSALQQQYSLQSYILRPVRLAPPPATTQPLWLEGFGVELQLKNMEYKVVDDSKRDDEPVVAQAVDDSELEKVTLDDTADVGGIVFSTLKQRFESNATALRSLQAAKLQLQQQQDALASKSNEIKAWQLQQLGTQLIQHVQDSATPLQTLQQTIQSFPSYVKTLIAKPLNPIVKAAVTTLHKNIQYQYGTTPTYMTINEQIVDDVEKLDVYTLYELLTTEVSYIDQFHQPQYHLTPAAITQLLSLRRSSGDSEERKVTLLRSQDRPHMTMDELIVQQIPQTGMLLNLQLNKAETQQSVFYLNDIERDSQYDSWPLSVSTFRQPRWPNQLVYVRRNIYTGVFFLDCTTQQGLDTYQHMRFFVEGNAPMRFAVAMVVGGDDESRLVTQQVVLLAYRYLVQTLQHRQQLQHKLLDRLRTLRPTVLDFSLHDIEDTFTTVLDEAGVPDAEEHWIKATTILQTTDDAQQNIQYLAQHQRFLQHTGLFTTPHAIPHVVAVINGLIYRAPIHLQSEFRDFMMSGVLGEQQHITKLVASDVITDSVGDIHELLMQKGAAVTRYAPYITNARTFLQQAVPPPDTLQYLTHPDYSYDVSDLTYVVVADTYSATGLQLVHAALQHIQQKHVVGTHPVVQRLAIVISPAAATNDLFTRLIDAIIQKFKPRKQLALLNDVVGIALNQSRANGDATAALSALYSAYKQYVETHTDDLVKQRLGSILSSSDTQFDAQRSRHILQQLGLPATINAIVANGQLYTLPVGEARDTTALQYDLQLIDSLQHQQYHLSAIKSVVTSLDLQDMLSDQLSDVVSELVLHVNRRLYSVDASEKHVEMHSSPGASSSATKSSMWAMLHSQTMHTFAEHCTIHYPSLQEPGNSPILKLQLAIDPLTPNAQKLIAMVSAVTRMYDGVDIELVMLPSSAYSDVPLKRYYRYAMSGAPPTYDKNGNQLPSASTVFKQLQTSALLSMNLVDTPESWLCSLSDSQYDIDNLLLSSLNAHAISIVYTLDALLINGQCLDPLIGPPAGMQLQLTAVSDEQQVLTDTLVMQNLGYYQLHAAGAGVQHITISPAHQAVYQFGERATDRVNDITYRHVISQWNSPYMQLLVERKPQTQHLNLLDLNTQHTQLTTSSYHFNADDVHVFSLASGFLYERFIRIMMLSVMKHTDKHVHFWLISNFLSPNVRASVEYMAQHSEYAGKFTPHFVSYRWPQWLRAQSEKQRIIWGYKILFLDVLFPLDVPRIVYIDADQVVRGDVSELMQMDLHGAPYAYVPFCDSNQDVEGFRFWKQGYWKDHLRGKPYHISALYVVDLVTFRRSRAGDTLRVTYDNLSADPQSLSNLDQDLPNYTQHQVPIYSLPIEWLFCETWCSMDTLKKAKTIDLCNNPLTKTPKLEMARTLIPEWTSLDNEVAAIERQRQQTLKQAADQTATAASTASTSAVPAHNSADHEDL